MKRASVLLLAILFAFIVPMAYGGGTFTTTLVKSSPGVVSSDCIPTMYNNPGFSDGYDSSRMLFFHDSWMPTGSTAYEFQTDQPYHRVRQELGQLFMIPDTASGDANMGAFAIRLPPAHNPDTGDGYDDPVRVGPGGREVAISIYKATGTRDLWPEDAQLLIQWKSVVPQSLDSDPCQPGNAALAQPGDWLKFALTPAYHLEKGKQYKIRFAFTKPQPASDVNSSRIYVYQNREAGYFMKFPPVSPFPRLVDKYGQNLEGTYKWGVCFTYNADNSFTPSPGPTYPYWCIVGRDYSFGFFPAAAGVKVAYGKTTGDGDFDGKVELGDFATMASNWKVNKQKPVSDMNIPLPLLRDIAVPTPNLAANDMTQVFPDPNYLTSPAGFTNSSPYVNWSRWPYYAAHDHNDANSYGLRSIAQSFKATSTATMGAIAVRLSTGIFPFGEDSSGYYTIKVYSLAGPNTVPTSGTLLKTFNGMFVQWSTGGMTTDAPMNPYWATYWHDTAWDSLYLGLGRNFRQGEWLIWRLPGGGVSLTANGYYSFVLEWNSDTHPYGLTYTDYRDRTFRIDTTSAAGPDAYTNGNAFYQSRNSSGVVQAWAPYANGRDLVFAVLPQQKQLCVADYEFSTWWPAAELPGHLIDWPYNYRYVPGFNAVAGDLDGDCKVDFKDVDVLMKNWLVSSWK